MFAKGLAAIIALSLVLPAGAASYAAGEEQRTTSTSSAAVRNHGNGTLRITIWYPAAGTERELDIGPAASPIFIAGRVAARAPFADATRHPLILASHGFGGTARQLTWLGAPLARHGFIVAAVDHPGTNGIDGVTPEGAYAPWERAGRLESGARFPARGPDARFAYRCEAYRRCGLLVGRVYRALLKPGRARISISSSGSVTVLHAMRSAIRNWSFRSIFINRPRCSYVRRCTT